MFSSYYNEKNLPILSTEKVTTYSFLLGMDYLQRDWFYLSSQIGFMRLGGKETNLYIQGNDAQISEVKKYVHLNTTFRAYLKASNLKFFLGIGPYINVLTDNRDFTSILYKPYYTFKNVYVGGKAEIGVTQDIKRFRVGITGDYLHNFSASASSQYINLNSLAFSGTVSVGYLIR